jgi:hypothetical protein
MTAEFDAKERGRWRASDGSRRPPVEHMANPLETHWIDAANEAIVRALPETIEEWPKPRKF